MRPVLALTALVAASGCGGDSPKGDANSANLVRENPNVRPSERTAEPPQLEPIGSDEVEQAGLQGAGCDFTVGEQLLLVAVQGDAIARVNGRIVHLVHAGPLGSTGGFFGSRDVRISVGRIEGAEQREDEVTSWPARIAVSSPTAGQPSRVEGRWSCGA